MENTNIVDKIQKLLALSESNYAGEAEAALAKARALMAKHKLTEKDVAGAETRAKIVTVETDVKYTTRTTAHFSDIVHAIVENSPVEYFVRHKHGSKTYRVCLVGYETDVAATLEIIHYAIEHVDAYAKRTRREMKKAGMLARDITVNIINYGFGFAEGIEAAFREQNVNTEEYGLVLVTPPEVMDAMPVLKKATSTCSVGYDSTAREAGYNAGKNTVLASSRGLIPEGAA